MSKFTYTVTNDDKENDLMVKEIIRKKFTFSSRLFSKLKLNNLIFLNDKPIRGHIKPNAGDIISVTLPDEISDFTPEPIPISIVYEDADLLIINKQPGFVVHPTKGKPCHTIANGIMKYILDTNQKFKIRFVNRLDMDTSGLLIVAKNSHAQDEFTKQMRANHVKKRYIAIVKGTLTEDRGTICAPIGRPDPEKVERGVMEAGHPSTTHYTVLNRYPLSNNSSGDSSKGYTMVELLLETGRTHQIRVHMSHLGHPVVGDHLYGGEAPWLIERQALHARYLSFYHPITGNFMEVEAPLPDDILKLICKIT